MKQRVSFRMHAAEFDLIRSDAREAGMSVSDYIRAAILRRPTQNRVAKTHADTMMVAQLAQQLMRIETMVLASAVSAYEAQIIAIAALPPEKAATVKGHRKAQFAVWREWGVKAAFIGTDMRPIIKKESEHE